MNRQLYTLILYLLLPLVLLRLYFRSRKVSAYGQRWRERLALGRGETKNKTIWVHAVSVGEVLGSAPLIKKLMDAYPEHTMLVTTMTPTGSDRVNELFGDSVVHCYAPYDLPDTVARFIKQYRPEILVLFETELWPNIIHACYQRQIPVILANGRMSERSVKGYSRFKTFVTSTLREIAIIAAQAPADAERFIRLGAEPARVKVTGSVKFDLRIDDSLQTQAKTLRRQWAGRPCLIAASTHQGEDEQVLAAFGKIKHACPNALLILVPRHPERFDSVAELIKGQGWAWLRRSEKAVLTSGIDVLLCDTMGELLLLYATADIAFVGGSLMATGGHNMLEPAALGLPVISGPHLFNFQSVSELLLEVNGMLVVHSSDALAMEVTALFANPQLAVEMGCRAKDVVNQNRGALERQLSLIQDVMAEKSKAQVQVFGK